MEDKNKDLKLVLVDLKHLGIDTQTPKIFSNVKSIVAHGILNEGKNMTYAQLLNRLNKSRNPDNSTSNRYWKNERYIIKECEIVKSEYTK